tara:strand:+ start:408 stop:1031 length:624 start_codon:yes stop_codon:yes gene_type:complete
MPYNSDFDIANGTGSQVRTQFNTALKALATHSASGTEPTASDSFNYQLWADTTNNKLKIRDASTSTTWHEIGALNTANLGLAKLDAPSFTGTAQFAGEVLFNSTGSIQLPSGTTGQRPGSATNGDIRYNSTDHEVEAYKNGSWENVGSGQGATGGNNGANACFWENELTITHDYTITAARGAGSFGNVVINTGKTVTIPAGSSWTVV